MNKIILSIAVLSVSASTVFAGDFNTEISVPVENQNGNHQNLVFEGTDVPNNTPGMNAGGAYGTTASCIRGGGVGIAAPGFGFSAGGGKLDEECNNREEAFTIAKLTGNGTHGLAHMCRTDHSVRMTMIQQNLCNPIEKHYKACTYSKSKNMLNVKTKDKYLNYVAVSQCQAAYQNGSIKVVN